MKTDKQMAAAAAELQHAGKVSPRFPVRTMTKSLCVAELFKMYQELTK